MRWSWLGFPLSFAMDASYENYRSVAGMTRRDALTLKFAEMTAFVEFTLFKVVFGMRRSNFRADRDQRLS
jgi:hypothetical protein